MSEKVVPEFARILNAAKPGDFAYFNFNHADVESHAPTAAECVSHLKLLHSFRRLKQQVVAPSPENVELEVKQWQVFTSNAVRRFVCYLSALRRVVGVKQNDGLTELEIYNNAKKRDQRVTDIMETHLPPLDVVMVWHAFMLSPKTYYDHFVRNNFLEFLFVPFPLRPLSDAIDDATFDYRPSEKLVTGFNNIMLQYDMEVQYFFSEPFNMYSIVVPLKCPICEELIGTDVPLTTPDRKGFTDGNFLYKDYNNFCLCAMPKAVTHDSLRKRQLCKDTTSKLPLPYIFKYYSHALNPLWMSDHTAWDIDEIVKKNIRNTILLQISSNFVALQDMVKDANYLYQYRLSNILRNYLMANLLYLTIPKPDTFVLVEDLVAGVLRQERFSDSVCDMDWLHSPVVRESMGESVIRYDRFMNIMRPTRMLVPTVDIDLVWHTHQLAPVFYYSFFAAKRGAAVVDHDDKVEQSRLDDCFERTAKYYKSQFGEEYSICYCWYCICIRNKAGGKLKALFKKKKADEEIMKEFQNSKLFTKTLGLTHISSHNSILLLNSYSDRTNMKIKDKYKNNLPWTEDKIYFYNYFPNLFVVPPVAPLTEDACRLYGEGLCMTNGGFKANCSGVKGCLGLFCGTNTGAVAPNSGQVPQ